MTEEIKTQPTGGEQVGAVPSIPQRRTGDEGERISFVMSEMLSGKKSSLSTLYRCWAYCTICSTQ